MEKVQSFLEFLVKSFVQFPEEVSVGNHIDERGILIVLGVAKADMGKVVGKSGQSARAIRQIVRLVAGHENIKVNLRIAEPAEEYVGI